MSNNHTIDSNITNPTMSILSQQQHLQNQLQLQNLQQQQVIQQKTKSFNSTRSQDTLTNLMKTLTLQHRKSSIHKDPRDPLTIQIPTTSNPTDLLAGRFSTWRSITKLLIIYLKEVSSVHEEIVRQQVRLQHLLSFPFNMQGINGELYQPFSQQPQLSSSLHDEVNALSKIFLPLGNGSIQDLPSTLFQFHTASSQMASSISKELSMSTIPRLEELKRDLLVKIKEIRGLQSDFKNTVNKEQQQTKFELQGYQNSLEICKNNPQTLQLKQDPYLLKVSLDKQIRKQLNEENFLHELFLNLQNSGKELEKVVVIELQALLTIAAKLLGQEAQLTFDILISKLDSGFITKDATFEWDNYISSDTEFVDPNLPMRNPNDIIYEGQANPLTLKVRAGFLERRSKYLKSYSKGWYVLTPTFIHEFKSADRKRDPQPVMSLSLDSVQVGEHSKKESDGSSGHKFVLHEKQNGIIHRGQKLVFRADSYDTMILWYNDIKKLTALPNPIVRSGVLADQRKKEALKRQEKENASQPASILNNRGDTMLSMPHHTTNIPPISNSTPQQVILDNSGVISLTQQQRDMTPQSYPVFSTPPRNNGHNGSSHNNNNINHEPDLTNTTVSSDIDFSTISDSHLHHQKTATTEDSLVTPPDLYDRLNDSQKQAFKRYSMETQNNGFEDGQSAVDRIFE